MENKTLTNSFIGTVRHISILTLETAVYIWQLFLINSKEALTLRGSFFASCFSMFINNFIFFIFWLILFERVETIGGWHLEDCALMFGLVAFTFGLMMIFAGGSRNMARVIAEGGLDALLTTPRPVLTSLLGSRSITSGWGDLLSGIVLVGLSGYHSPIQLILILLTSLCGAVTFAMTGVILHSLAFWLGPVNQLARQVHEFLITFSLYPGPIYTGWLEIVVFTTIPAGFISILPVETIRDFSPTKLVAVLVATLFYTLLALAVFKRGLRRYESGSSIGVRW